MLKQTGKRVAEIAKKIQDGVLGGYRAAIKVGGHMDNLHKFGHAMLKIAAPHIGEAAKHRRWSEPVRAATRAGSGGSQKSSWCCWRSTKEGAASSWVFAKAP